MMPVWAATPCSRRQPNRAIDDVLVFLPGIILENARRPTDHHRWPFPTSRPQAPLAAVASRRWRGPRRGRSMSGEPATMTGGRCYRASRPGGRPQSGQCGQHGHGGVVGLQGESRARTRPWRCGADAGGDPRSAPRTLLPRPRRRRLPVPEGTRGLLASSFRLGERRCELRLSAQLVWTNQEGETFPSKPLSPSLGSGLPSSISPKECS